MYRDLKCNLKLCDLYNYRLNLKVPRWIRIQSTADF